MTPLSQFPSTDTVASLRRFATGTRHAVVITDAHRRITWVNAAFTRISGYSIDEAAGRSPGALLQCAETDPAVVAELRAALSAGRGCHAVILNRSRDGRRYWLDLDIQPFGPPDGPPDGFIAIEFDLTQPRATLARLHETLEGIGTGTWEWSIGSGELRHDDRAAEILERPTPVTGPSSMQAWSAIMHPADRDHVEAKLREHLAGRDAFYDTECRVLRGADDWRWVRIRGRLASRDPTGRPLTMYGVLEDIDERKRAEISAARAYAMLQTLFELAPTGIALVELDPVKPADFNAALCTLLGYRRDELLGDSDAHRAPADLLDPDRANLRAVGAEGRYGPAESTMRHRSGRLVEPLLSSVRVSGDDGRSYMWSIVQDISERKAMERAMRSALRDDPLTGLPNRTELMKALERLIDRTARSNTPTFAVMLLDIDRFKLVNDTLGHAAGDALLIEFGKRLQTATQACFGRDDGAGAFAARFGGDEFVVVAWNIDGASEAMVLADRIHAVLSPSCAIAGRTLHTSVSIGIALGGEGPADAHDLLRNADTAMYESKRAGRGGTVVFDQPMHARLARTLAIEAGLREAIERREFTLLYQPIVDLDTGVMSSVEALLRWQNDTLGAVPPVEFIPVAEDSRQIVAIGEWVLREACGQWARWHAADPLHAPACMSVNLSRVQMALGNTLLLQVRSALADVAMPASALQLEITEREVMIDPAGALDLMRSLSAMGVRLAMDDFGTGTSSLGCLRDYPFHTIKIDKTFVSDLGRDPHVLAVAHATVNVIENLGMVSVAEGIEEPAEAAMLQAMGCRYGQGYLFARPQPADRVLDLARRGALRLARDNLADTAPA